jgi:hypothetical protein
VSSQVPLPTLLSWAWMAHTIEADNEFERAMREAGPAPRFRTSLVMWANFLRFLPPDGIPADDLAELAMAPVPLVRSTLGGLERWGYVVVGSKPTGGRRDGFGSRRGIRSATVIAPTEGGRRAQATWPAVLGTIEARWQTRFGAERVDALRRALRNLLAGLDRPLPLAPPIVGPAKGFQTELCPTGGAPPAEDVDRALGALLAQPLVAFTTDVEAGGRASMPLGANLLRVGEDAVPVRRLPSEVGISKEAVAMAVGWLARQGLATVAADPAARAKVFRLTEAGLVARHHHAERIAAVEQRWRIGFGAGVVDDVRGALEAVVDQPLVLAEGLVPPPGCWRGQRPYLTQTRALRADPTGALPRHPMVLHRGGWPDGS